MSVNTAILRSFSCLMLLFLAACGTGENAQITKKWKTIDIKNSSLDREFAYYQTLMDTITENNERLEFFDNSVDSFKRFTTETFKEQRELMKREVENSFMEFNPNGNAYFTSINGVDSAKWKIEENEIVLDTEEFTGVPGVIRLAILELSNDNLKLKKVDQYDTSIITLKARNL